MSGVYFVFDNLHTTTIILKCKKNIGAIRFKKCFLGKQNYQTGNKKIVVTNTSFAAFRI